MYKIFNIKKIFNPLMSRAKRLCY